MSVPLPGIKPVWSGCTKDNITLLSLVARIFASILTSEFRREIGRYESGCRGSLPGLGITTIRASRMESGREPLSSASEYRLRRWGTRVSQLSLYHSPPSPSSPGVLPGGNDWMASSTSSAESGASSSNDCAGVSLQSGRLSRNLEISTEEADNLEL
ncbi:hypothetical protein GDO81_001346 [Engystomops pustulosus]|uniref:Uncharacterized protein n=1 Tax=Engystomops pustulosus TaxID=76066 RepID=A0AAV7DBK2_ENGPU|nr:hypothetical protein GDO81_001346 [Engystomops pustulosus]